LAENIKGENIEVYDVAEHLRVADYFVVITGISRPHVKALASELHVKLKTAGETHSRTEGGDSRWWVLLDYGDVVVHLMQQDAREFYDIDRLYQECSKLDWKSVELPEALPS